MGQRKAEECERVVRVVFRTKQQAQDGSEPVCGFDSDAQKTEFLSFCSKRGVPLKRAEQTWLCIHASKRDKKSAIVDSYFEIADALFQDV